MSTQADYLITVAVDDRPIGIFDSRTGGEIATDITKRPTGEGMKVYRGRPSTGDVTVVRGYERERDHELARGLEQRVGRAKVTVSEQPLDDEGNAWGRPKVLHGILRSVDTGDANAASTDPRDLTLVIVVKDND